MLHIRRKRTVSLAILSDIPALSPASYHRILARRSCALRMTNLPK
ncbi:hypothetical protein OHAE_367 [Ochrobactrum soli]|uniref:Uncharacterized protein n=1 Tax=Ochrobactrum soli TaxID=2448455 RepID=A0A2P9HL08_9HYPH|nr:hypothetical protein OHAE_367 [[Ochrobactrum] soli]